MTQTTEYYIFISDIDVFRVIERDRYFADPNRAGLNSYRVDDQRLARIIWENLPKEYNFKVYMVPLKGSSVDIIGPDCAILTPVEQEKSVTPCIINDTRNNTPLSGVKVTMHDLIERIKEDDKPVTAEDLRAAVRLYHQPWDDDVARRVIHGIMLQFDIKRKSQ